jgi:hypothetical protein
MMQQANCPISGLLVPVSSSRALKIELLSVTTHVTSSDRNTKQYRHGSLGNDTRNDTGTFIAENHSLWDAILDRD